MSDIVDRLRNWWSPDSGGMSGAEANTDDLIQEAADEIEKLRAALEEVRPLVLGANQSKDRYPKTRAALGEKE